MKQFFTVFCILLSGIVTAQVTATFDEIGVPLDSFFNNANGKNWSSGDIILPNTYTEESWGASWSGWSISAMRDTTTAGFTNQYSAITGRGYSGSAAYAVGFGNHNILLDEIARNKPMKGMYVTNSTYAYLSMKNGDSFAKKFGGEDGSDPDFFSINIKGMKDGSVVDSIEFFLADFRDEDNSKDYIIDEWTYVDLTSLGAVDSLVFDYASSDVGQWGINTPKYICIDNITTQSDETSTADPLAPMVSLYPNPAVDFIHVSGEPYEAYTIRSIDGKIVAQGQYSNRVDVSNIPGGRYVFVVRKGLQYAGTVFVK